MQRKMTITIDEAVYAGLHQVIERGNISNDISNRHLARVQVIPLSSQVEWIYPSETVVTLSGQTSKVMADQIMGKLSQKWHASLTYRLQKKLPYVAVCLVAS